MFTIIGDVLNVTQSKLCLDYYYVKQQSGSAEVIYLTLYFLTFEDGSVILYGHIKNTGYIII